MRVREFVARSGGVEHESCAEGPERALHLRAHLGEAARASRDLLDSDDDSAERLRKFHWHQSGISADGVEFCKSPVHSQSTPIGVTEKPQRTFVELKWIQRGHCLVFIAQVITPEFIKEKLIKWSSRQDDISDSGDAVRFITSLRHIKDVYKFLLSDMVPKDLQDLLHTHHVIFVPTTPEAAKNAYVPYEGRFLGECEQRFWATAHSDKVQLAVVTQTFCCLVFACRAVFDLFVKSETS